MEKIDKSSHIPYYIQIKDIIKKRIRENIYQKESFLPSENELSQEFQVTRATIRHALKDLKNEDIITTERGKGSKVRGRKIKQSLTEFYSFGRRFVRDDSDNKAESKIIEKNIKKCPMEVSEKLSIPREEKIYEIIRLRMLEEEPLMIELSYIPVKQFPDLFSLDMEGNSLYDILEYSYNTSITKAEEYIHPRISKSKESKFLNIEKGSPVFYVERTTYSNEAPIEYRKNIIRGDKYVFYAELS
jgi:GntR family transcriptional regulator